ncbi:MAG TPA: thioredoxin domain-containing protein [Acidimicrobiales bacterium]|nr:thioredoxin domain-containing protein [Acidimicrobiales bacterium]
MTAIPEVDLVHLDRVLGEESRAVLVDFWSPWCPPCRVLRPHLDALARAYAETVAVVAVNVERHPAAAERFGVSALPTLVLVREGVTVHRFAGSTLPSQVQAVLDTLAEHPATG